MMELNDELNQLLEDDTVQFPRLITAIMESIDFTTEDFLTISENMDLTTEEVNNIFERAQAFIDRKLMELSE